MTSPARGSAGGRPPQRRQRPTSDRPQDDAIAVLAKAAGAVGAAVDRGRVTPGARARFQAVAGLIRELREQLRSAAVQDGQVAASLKRLDGLATVLARTAARDASLLALLADDAPVLLGTKELMTELRREASMPEPQAPEPVADEDSARLQRQVIPQSVVSRQLANPFLAPDYSVPPPPPRRGARLLAGWELLGPLLRSFEETPSGATSSMDLPSPGMLHAAAGRELMPHQSQVVAAAAEGHRTFLLADEPGLGKTAQSLLAAKAADAYPLLVVCPNVVKASWAHEAKLWTPQHPATIVHSDGEDIDAFADIIIVNYDILDRHAGWLGTLGFRGMVVDEAHFIKNKTSQRSRYVLQLADQLRKRTLRPLLMALTGTPLINDIEDFLAIWEFLGWIRDDEPGAELLEALEDNGYTPAERDFYPEARQAVIDQGIVRRRKLDVIADLPARRIADMPVELDGAVGESVREAERALARRLVRRYDSALAAREESSGIHVEGIDFDLVRQVASWERRDAKEASDDGNVFTLMRRIGQAKANLAADYAAQLARSAGKVVFFAKHIDVMDAAEETFRRRDIRFSSIRGDQTPKVRQASIEEFVKDPDVSVVVCSLTAAGVGINLQVASNVVLAELSWTAAEQTQAIDRVHRIGQDQPVTAWRIIAAQTIDARVAELIDSKANLAARALDGAEVDESAPVDVQLEALVSLLLDALRERQ